MEKKFATRETLSQANDLPTTELFVPEWDCWVKVRTLTGPERDAWEDSLIDMSDGEPKINRKGRITRLCAMALAGEDGSPLYGLEREHELRGKNGAALYRIFEKAHEWNKLGKQDFEGDEKNSESAPGGASLSVSPSNGVAPSLNCLHASIPANLPN